MSFYYYNWWCNQLEHQKFERERNEKKKQDIIKKVKKLLNK